MRLERSHVDAGERETEVLVRRDSGEEPRSVLVFVGLPIGVILILVGVVWAGAALVLIAAAEVVRLRLDRHRLERRLDRLTRELGEAVFNGNPALAELVNDETHETAAELQAAAEERERVLLAARSRIGTQWTSAAGGVESDGRRRQ